VELFFAAGKVVAKKAGTEDGKAAQNINNTFKNPKTVLIWTS